MITNNNIFPGTSINLSTNLINIGFGQKVLVDAGIVNTAVIGGWNRLLAGSSTIIHLGSKMHITLADAINVNLGKSSNYFDENDAIHWNDFIFAVNELLINAGVANLAQQQIKTHETQEKYALLSVLAMFAFTLGMTILFIAYPPFKKDSASNQFNQSGIIILIGEISSVISLLLFQFLYARSQYLYTKSDKTLHNNQIDQFSTKLSLSAKGLSAVVYDDAAGKTQPTLVRANDNENNLKYDYYNPGTTGFSIFGMLPGMPQENENPTNEQDAKNWRNPQYGIYNHNQTPSLTLGSQDSYDIKPIDSNNFVTQMDRSTIDLLSDSIILAAERIRINKKSTASIYLNPTNTYGLTLQCSENINTNHNMLSTVCLSDTSTSIIQKNGIFSPNTQDQRTDAAGVTIDMSYKEESNYTIEYGLYLYNNFARIFCKNSMYQLIDGQDTYNSILIEESQDEKIPQIKFNILLKDIAVFDENVTKIGNCIFASETAQISQYLTVKFNDTPLPPSSSQEPSSDPSYKVIHLVPRKNQADQNNISDTIFNHHQERINQIKQHIRIIQGIKEDAEEI